MRRSRGIRAWSPEQRQKVERAWSDLFRDVEAVLDTDPASAPGSGTCQALDDPARGIRRSEPDAQR
jgi:hypothetical protein